MEKVTPWRKSRGEHKVEKHLTYDAVGEAVEELPQAASRRAGWKDFFILAKPGILFSNSITAFGGFWVASGGQVDWLKLLLTLAGTILVMASGCVLNNYLDRDLDSKMARTRKRATAAGLVAPKTVLWYGISLGVAGIAVLGLGVNILSALLGLIGLFVYVWIYTAWLKRTSTWSTMIGGVAGAVPPVIGYCAVTGNIDLGAGVLFSILFLWQPPHFWALGIRRLEEYRAAGFPLLPVVKGVFPTQISMVRYVVLLVPVSLLMYLLGYVGEIYLTAAAALGLYWAYLCLRGFMAGDQIKWAKKNFVFSINYLTILFVVMVIDTVSR